MRRSSPSCKPAAARRCDLRQKLAGRGLCPHGRLRRAIADWFGGAVSSRRRFPPTLHVSLQAQTELRYGENPHQQGAVYAAPGCSGVSVLIAAQQLNGKELSYNNLLDLDSALAIVRLARPSRRRRSSSTTIPAARRRRPRWPKRRKKALDGDPQSAFGGVLAFNRAVDAATAEVLAAPGLFIEAIVAPDFDAGRAARS